MPKIRQKFQKCSDSDSLPQPIMSKNKKSVEMKNQTKAEIFSSTKSLHEKTETELFEMFSDLHCLDMDKIALEIHRRDKFE